MGALLKSFRESEAWKKARELTPAVYGASGGFPKSEQFGLTNQLRRSAASVAANLAEGYGRRSKGELHRFSMIANGSLEETRYFVILARDLGYLPADKSSALLKTADRVGVLMGGIERSTRK